jgi:hypothetical protein
MSNFSLFVLLFLLQNAVLCADSACAKKFLVTATNQTNGVEVRIFPDVNSDKSSYKSFEINGFFLSPECGERFGKCNQPLVVTVSDSASSVKHEHSSVVVLPLAKALGLLKLSTGSGDLRHESNIIDLSDGKYNCSPASVYNIQDSYYIVCVNADTHNVKLLKLRLNATNIQKSYLPDQRDPAQRESVHNLTNSLYVDLPAQSGPVIFFATGYSAFYFKPLLNLMEELDIQLQENKCFATSIDYIGEWEMLIYCDNDRAVYVDLNREFIFESVEYAKDGRPYVCPNPDIYLAVYMEEEYILYTFRSTVQRKNFELSGSSFDNGVCLGSQNVTLFAFTDRERGTQVLNATAGSIKSLSGAMCINHPCQPLVVLQDRYLVIRENRGASWYTSVLDSHNNFSVVLEAQHSNADLMGLIDVGVCSFSPDPLGPTDSQNGGSPHTVPVAVTVFFIFGGLVFLASLVMILIIIIIIRRRRRQGHNKDGSSPTVVAHEQRQNVAGSIVVGSENINQGAVTDGHLEMQVTETRFGIQCVTEVSPPTEDDGISLNHDQREEKRSSPDSSYSDTNPLLRGGNID